jgi:hypothetical protein
VRCECGYYARSRVLLVEHRKRVHSEGSNRAAAEILLGILRKQGTTNAIDTVRVQTIRSLADALDSDPANAQLWKVYREAVEELMRRDDKADAGLAAALAEISSVTPMGDASQT